MEPKELRIGNLIFDKDGNVKTVFAVLNNGIVFESNQYIGTPNEWCNPISLTEEWLIKFGFKETDYAGGCYYLGSLQIDLSDFECAFKTNWLDCKVQYVHKLQNLYFALANEELTLES